MGVSAPQNIIYCSKRGEIVAAAAVCVFTFSLEQKDRIFVFFLDETVEVELPK